MADDDADDRLLAKDALGDCDLACNLRFVDNGEKLMDYLFQRGAYENGEVAPRPDLILLDLNMPRLDGREALSQIKSDPELRRIPVVVLTTSNATTDISNIYDLGANSFITKPVTYEQLVTVMATIGRYWFKTVELP